MRTLRGLVAATALICSASGTPNGAKKMGPITSLLPDAPPNSRVASNPAASSAIGNDAALVPPAENSPVRSSALPGNDRTVTQGATKNEAIPIDYDGVQSVAVKVAIASTTTALAISVATVGATATETVGVNADSAIDIDPLATAAVGNDQPISLAANSSDATTLSDTDSPDSTIRAIPAWNGTVPFDASQATDPSVFGLSRTSANRENKDDTNLTGPIPSISNGSVPDTNGILRKRQEVTQKMPDIDSISFQTHTSEGFNQPRIVPVFEAVVDTTTTSSSTTTTDTSTTLTSGTTTTTTTSTTSETGTTVSTTTSWQDISTVTTSSGVAIVTEWTTASTTTCIPAESHTSYTAVPPIQTMCSDTTTLCTVTVAYVISMDPTMTSYYTTPFDTTALAGVAATQTVYSEDPNGFHVYMTTQDDSSGSATATFYFTTPTPTAVPQQVTSSAAHKIARQTSIFSASLAALWGLILYCLVVF
ncbi:hypothetical protein TWF696_001622 [Orbilia brochopaga]|uniref:Uncharacterized protein n=1 Tax=Orbilia brochopaga TaxID=3140254 RepID=A0AAV9UD64_9PEZI